MFGFICLLLVYYWITVGVTHQHVRFSVLLGELLALPARTCVKSRLLP